MNCTVVIPVKEDALIHRAIASVPADVEIVVGLSNSPPEFIAELTQRYQGRLTLAYVDLNGMAAALNIGVAIAKNDNIVVLDSDCFLHSPATLTAYIEELEAYNFVRGITRMERSSFWSHLAAKGTEAMNDKFGITPRLFGPSIAFSRKRYLHYGGYDEAMSSGSCDHEFTLRLEQNNEPIGFAPEAIIYHKPLNFTTDVRSHYGYGLGMHYIDIKHRFRYGKGICTAKLHPRELWKKLRSRGPLSPVRSVLLGVVMLLGYANYQHPKGDATSA